MSTTVCAEKLQKFHSSQQNLHHLHNIDVPPRKLLSRRAKTASSSSKSNETAEDEALFRRFLPYNSSFDDDDDDPYSSSDHFRMFEFKIRRCTRSRSHDWTDCPFSHPGEKARRRNPRRVAYSGTVCPEFRRGGCSRGDSCELAHGVFECWLHPARYRTEACKDGKHCKRKVCFFAHTPRQLRVLPPNCDSQKTSSPASAGCRCNHCCVFCLHHQNNNNNNNPNSPTSTLLSLSPPRSPIKNNMSSARLSYDEALAQLLASLNAMNVVDNGDNYSHLVASGGSYPWMDQSGFSVGGENNETTYSLMNHLQQSQFIVSPSTTTRHNLNIFGSGRSNSLLDTNASSFVFGTSCTSIDDTPDNIAWVDELLM